MKLSLSVCVLVALMASSAMAEILVHVIPNPQPAPGYMSVNVYLLATETVVGAIDLDVNLGRGFTGPLSQRQAALIDTPDTTYAAFISPQDWAMDSHFLFNSSADLIPMAGTLTESSTYLGIVAGIPLNLMSDNFLLAQIVAPIGSQVYMNAEVAEIGLPKTVLSNIPIMPEPASLSLLILIPLISRSRRRASFHH